MLLVQIFCIYAWWFSSYEFISNLLVALLPIFEMGAGLNNYVSSMCFYVFAFYLFLNGRFTFASVFIICVIYDTMNVVFPFQLPCAPITYTKSPLVYQGRPIKDFLLGSQLGANNVVK